MTSVPFHSKSTTYHLSVSPLAHDLLLPLTTTCHPPQTFDWDVFLRLDSNRLDRDCIIPDISRTYHFGYVGNHVSAGMQFAYFYDHALNTVPDVKLKNVAG